MFTFLKFMFIYFNVLLCHLFNKAIERVLSTRYLPVKLMQNVVRTCIKKLDSRGKNKIKCLHCVMNYSFLKSVSWLVSYSKEEKENFISLALLVSS